MKVFYKDQLFATCGNNTNTCGDYKYCLQNEYIDYYVAADEQIKIRIEKGSDSGIPSACNYSLWADVTVTCYQTGRPTPFPSNAPTESPTSATPDPTFIPTNEPTINPTPNPTNPTKNPSETPTTSPTSPTMYPTFDPSMEPTSNPTYDPTSDPTQPPNNKYEYWEMSATIFSRQTYRLPIGFDENTGAIYLIGGGNRKAMDIFFANSSNDNAISNRLDLGTDYLAQEIIIHAINWAQHGNYLYIRSQISSQYLIKMDLFTSAFEYNSINVNTSAVAGDPCITSVSLAHDYLIVIAGGGIHTNFFDLDVHIWITNGNKPYLNSERVMFVCAVVDQNIYAIAGLNDGTGIVRLDISKGIEHIKDFKWKYINQTIPQAIYHLRHIVYDRDIVIIGGYRIPDNLILSTIYVVDTLNEKVRLAGNMQYGSILSAPILAYPYIYSFSGWTDFGVAYTYQYHKLKLKTSLP